MQKRILLVDDNEDLLLITQVILKSGGYLVDLAKTVNEAQRAIAAAQPHLIVLDMNLQGEDGAAFCRQLKAAAGTSDVAVILMSGDDDHPALAGSGADDFLAKPFDFSELTARVEKQLTPLSQQVG